MSKKIRGKKPTFSQRKALERRRGINPDDYLFVRSEVTQESGGNLTRASEKKERLVFVHRDSGDILEVPSV